jgi:malate dehydrogenase (oxaloacetate-decarboxylating)
VCSFNDDIQGTAAVTAAAVRSGLHRTDVTADDVRVVIVGAGSAGTGVADELVRFLVGAGVPESAAIGRCWLVDRYGLLHDGMDDLHDFQRRYAMPSAAVPGDGSLTDVVGAYRPHVLVGVSGQPGLFTEEVVRSMAAGVDRPIVLPLSNPTPRAEAIPADVLAWTDGRALIGTGSPFPPTSVHGRDVVMSPVNNISIFPGVGLGVVAVGATEVTDSMITAASGAVAELAVAMPEERLLPPVEQSGECAHAVAVAVAQAAVDAGVARIEPAGGDLSALIDVAAWRPIYR